MFPRSAMQGTDFTSQWAHLLHRGQPFFLVNDNSSKLSETQLLPPRNQSLGPAPSIRSVRLGGPGVALALGTPWSHLERAVAVVAAAVAVGGPRAAQAQPGARTARSTRVARPPRCFPPLGCPPRRGRRLRPSHFPGPRVPSSVSASRSRRVKLEPGCPQLPLSPPQPGGRGCSAPARAAFAPSVCPHLGFLPLIRCRSGLFTL